MPEELPPKSSEPQSLRLQRWRLLYQLENALDKPIIALAFVWLALLVIELTAGLNAPLQAVNLGIWGLFGLHFALGLLIAPDRRLYLRRNWLTGLSLLLPAFGVLRLFRALRLLRLTRAVRTVGLLRLITSLNRGMRALAAALGRRGIGYVALLTVLVVLAGAAGMLYFEGPAAPRDAGQAPTAGFHSFAEALWFTAMLMTTIGTEQWPQTGEGRMLMWLLSIYGLAVFGYLTATIASIFIGADREQQESGPAGTRRQIKALQAEVKELRAQLAEKNETPPDPPAASD